jgi:hypothetical protein
VHLAEDRRERELGGLEQGDALLEDEALEEAVEVLAVRAVAVDRQASCSVCSRSWAIVLISPLCPSTENGWTRLKVG